MRYATLTQTENAYSVSVCVTLIYMWLEISLTALIETSPVTATGNILSIMHNIKLMLTWKWL